MGLGLAAAAAELLFEHDSIEADVFDAAYLRPYDEAALLASAQKTGRVLTIEEHSVVGGLGTHRRGDGRAGRADACRLDQVALPDQDLEVGVPAELYEYYGLTACERGRPGPQPGQEVTTDERREPLLDPTGDGDRDTNTTLAMPRPQSLRGPDRRAAREHQAERDRCCCTPSAASCGRTTASGRSGCSSKSYFGTPVEESVVKQMLHNCDFAVAAIGD